MACDSAPSITNIFLGFEYFKFVFNGISTFMGTSNAKAIFVEDPPMVLLPVAGGWGEGVYTYQEYLSESEHKCDQQLL